MRRANEWKKELANGRECVCVSERDRLIDREGETDGDRLRFYRETGTERSRLKRVGGERRSETKEDRKKREVGRLHYHSLA